MQHAARTDRQQQVEQAAAGTAHNRHHPGPAPGHRRTAPGTGGRASSTGRPSRRVRATAMSSPSVRIRLSGGAPRRGRRAPRRRPCWRDPRRPSRPGHSASLRPRVPAARRCSPMATRIAPSCRSRRGGWPPAQPDRGEANGGRAPRRRPTRSTTSAEVARPSSAEENSQGGPSARQHDQPDGDASDDQRRRPAPPLADQLAGRPGGPAAPARRRCRSVRRAAPGRPPRWPARSRTSHQ